MRPWIWILGSAHIEQGPTVGKQGQKKQKFFIYLLETELSDKLAKKGEGQSGLRDKVSYAPRSPNTIPRLP